MNRFNIVKLLLSIWLTLALQQSLYEAAAFAASNSLMQTELLTFVPLGASITTTTINANQKYYQLIDRGKRFMVGTTVFAFKFSGDEINGVANEEIPRFARCYLN